MYRIRSTGETKSQGEVRSMYPNSSLPRVWDSAVCDDLGIDPILETPAPTTTRFQSAFHSGLEQDSLGNWVWSWTVTDWDEEHITTATEAQATTVRTDRNKRLSDSDWTQTMDAPVDQVAWATYRQELRDISTQEGFPWDVIWPETL